MDGQETVTNGRTAAQGNKAAFKTLIPSLPEDWRKKMKAHDEYYASDKGNTRLTHIRSGAIAPSLEELNFLRSICEV